MILKLSDGENHVALQADQIWFDWEHDETTFCWQGLSWTMRTWQLDAIKEGNEIEQEEMEKYERVNILDELKKKEEK